MMNDEGIKEEMNIYRREEKKRGSPRTETPRAEQVQSKISERLQMYTASWSLLRSPLEPAEESRWGPA